MSGGLNDTILVLKDRRDYRCMAIKPQSGNQWKRKMDISKYMIIIFQITDAHFI